MAPVNDVRALILAGGSGTRLWPMSTDARPKPFLPLAGPESLLRQTFRRAAELAGPENVWISGRASHGMLIRRELPKVAESRLILEPRRRNTAPAIALSALAVEAESPGAVLVVLPSDQAVADESVFAASLRTAVEAARQAGLAESHHVTTFEDTVALLLKRLAPGDAVLVKGSRGMRMERVVDALVARFGGGAG